jgi:hypothetical protein
MAEKRLPRNFSRDLNWKNYEVSVDVLVEGAGFASLFGRVGKIEQNDNPPRGIWLKADTAGKWELSARKEKVETDKNGKPKTVGEQVVLATGEAPFTAERMAFVEAVVLRRDDPRHD